MSNSKAKDLKAHFDALENTMHEADQFHTLDEQVADMRRRGIEPNQGYEDVDAKESEDDWGDDNWKENGKWEPKTSDDLDSKAKKNWNGDNGDTDTPPIV